MADKRSVVALNLGSQRIGGAKFSLGKGGALILKDYAFTEILGDPAADSSRIAQLEVAVAEITTKLKANNQPTHWAMSGQSVFTRFVKLPPLGNENVDKLVAFEAQQNVPFPMNEVIWDYQFVGENAAGDVEVVLVAIKADSLNDYNDAVEGAPLKTEVVDVAPLALYNAFRYNYGDLEQSAVVIDIGARSTNLVLYDGDRAFTRNIPVGGSLITSNIAKEFRVSFTKAEQRKIESGFVALGGAYADHEDPEIAAMSKVIRNTLSRLHAEIGRTASFYRSQQGGRPPEIAFLAGGCAGLPYIREFFKEKLNIPVEYFNPLRNVAMGPGVDAENAARDAHSMGELVGLGLRGIGNSPMELDLVPDTVDRRRDITKRKPFLILTTVALLSLLGAGIFYFKRATTVAKEQLARVQAEYQALNRDEKKIKAISLAESEVDELAAPLKEVAAARAFWVQVLAELNNKLQNDLLWLTEIEPLSGDQSVTDPLSASSTARPSFEGFAGFGSSAAGANEPAAGEEASEGLIDTIRIRGLWRINGAGQQIVYDYLDNLSTSEVFALKGYETNREKYVTRIDSEVSAEPRWAYPFELRIPLTGRIKLHDK